MAGEFTGPEGPFDRIYFTQQELIDIFIGKRIWSSGNNFYGALGTNDTVSKSSPVTTAGGGTNWVKVSNGLRHASAIKTDGTLWSWGSNIYGQSGNTSFGNISPITPAGGGTNWKDVSCGQFHTAAVKTDGTLWTWGYNLYGGLGTNNTSNYSSPVTTAAGGNDWKSVNAGFYHTAAIKTDNSLWIWGYSQGNVLGGAAGYSSPAPISGLNWKMISCGFYHNAAIKTDGTLWTWGRNFEGQCATGTTGGADVNTPVTTVVGGNDWKTVACGSYHTIAIKNNGTLWTWGYNFYGQLGNNTSGTANVGSPITTVSGGTDWKSVGCGHHSSYGIKTDGRLWSWGYNSEGQLMTNDKTNRSSPVTAYTGAISWKSIAGSFDLANGIGE